MFTSIATPQYVDPDTADLSKKISPGLTRRLSVQGKRFPALKRDSYEVAVERYRRCGDLITERPPPPHELPGVYSGRERCSELLQFYCSRVFGARWLGLLALRSFQSSGLRVMETGFDGLLPYDCLDSY